MASRVDDDDATAAAVDAAVDAAVAAVAPAAAPAAAPSAPSSSTSVTMAGGVPSTNGRKIFPQILMDVLSLATTDPIIAPILTWDPSGTFFRILSRPALEDIIIPQYFGTAKSSKFKSSTSTYASFVRKLNRWGFRRLSSKGELPEAASFHHPQFRRDAPELAETMECVCPTPRQNIVFPGAMAQASRAARASTTLRGAGSAPPPPPGQHGDGLSMCGAPGYYGSPPLPGSEQGSAAAAAAYGSCGAGPAGSHSRYSHVGYPGQYAIDQHQAAMAAAEARWSAAGGMTGGFPPSLPPSTLPTTNSTAAASHLGSEVFDPEYLAKLEAMALARRDRALQQYRAASANVREQQPIQQQEGEGQMEGEEKEEGANVGQGKEITENDLQPSQGEEGGGGAGATAAASSSLSTTGRGADTSFIHGERKKW